MKASCKALHPHNKSARFKPCAFFPEVYVNLSNEEIELRRAEHVAKDQEAERTEKTAIADVLFEVTRIIGANAGHIGCVALVVQASEGDALINTEDGSASEAISCLLATDAKQLQTVLWHLKEQIKRAESRLVPPLQQGMMALPIRLEDLLGGLRMPEPPKEGGE